MAQGFISAEDGRPIRLVASDLDGTLLTGGITAPRPHAIELIRELTARGVLFFAASGRQRASLRRMFAPVADQMGYVCENGALVVVGGEVIVEREIDRSLAMAVCRAVEEYPHADLLVSAPRQCYIREGNREFLLHLRMVVRNDVACYRVPEDIDEPVIKMAFRIPHDEIPEATRHFTMLFGDYFDVVTSGNIWIDFLPRGVNKGTALEAAGERLGIAPVEMAAFGDNENDREMLDTVGHPYLMETCNPTMRGLNERIRYVDSVEGELERLLGRA